MIDLGERPNPIFPHARGVPRGGPGNCYRGLVTAGRDFHLGVDRGLEVERDQLCCNMIAHRADAGHFQTLAETYGVVLRAFCGPVSVVEDGQRPAASSHIATRDSHIATREKWRWPFKASPLLASRRPGPNRCREQPSARPASSTAACDLVRSHKFRGHPDLPNVRTRLSRRDSGCASLDPLALRSRVSPHELRRGDPEQLLARMKRPALQNRTMRAVVGVWTCS